MPVFFYFRAMLKQYPFYLLFLLPLLSFAQPLTPAMQQHNDSLWDLTLQNPPLSLPYGKKLLTKALQLQQAEWAADVCARLSVAYDMLGYKDSAIFFALKALPVYEQNNDLADMAFVYNGLGLIYYSQKQYKRAIYYHKKSLRTEIERSNPEGAASSLVNLGICYAYIDSTALSIRYYLQADSIYHSNDLESLRPDALSNLLNLYMRLGRYTEAHETLSQFKKIQRPLDTPPETEVSQLLVEATLLYHTGHTRAALLLSQKAARIAEQYKIRYKMQECYNRLASIHAGMQQYETAYYYQQQSRVLADSLYNVQLATEVNNLNLQYETEKKDRALAELRFRNLQEIQKQRLQDEELREKRTQVYILGAATFIVIILLLMLIYIISINRHNNRLLQEKNRLTEENLRNRDILLGEVHHRVKNNLQLVVSILQLQSRSTDNDTVKQVFAECIRRISIMGDIHQQLYTGDSYKNISIRPFIQEIVQAFAEEAPLPAAGIRTHTDVQDLQLPLHYAVPLGLIINELLTNSAKYAFPGRQSGHIGVQLSEQNGELILLVYDNGSGFEAAEASRESSFGMRLIQSMSRQIGARWHIEHSSGTRHIFFIPFHK